MRFSTALTLCMSLLLLVSACTGNKQDTAQKEPVVASGKTITFDYAAGFDNGTIFDTSFEDAAKKADIYDQNRSYRPIIIVYGKDRLVPGYEETLLGMKIGSIKNVRLPPEKAYGPYIVNSTLVVPRNKIKEQGELKIGSVITLVSPQGQKLRSYIKKLGDENVTVDLNHPLAGEYIQFSVVVRGIE